MTREEIIQSEKEFLNAADIADVLGVDPQSIRAQAAFKPALLGFPVVRIGARTKIPRRQFVKFMGWEG